MYDMSTSAEAARRKRNQRLKAVGDPLEGMEEADSVVPDIEALWEVVRKLIPHDKTVQLHFDEVCTNQAAVYSRAEDTLCGCGYIRQMKLPET